MKLIKKKTDKEYDEQKKEFIKKLLTLSNEQKASLDMQLDIHNRTLSTCSKLIIASFDLGFEDFRPESEKKYLVDLGMSVLKHANSMVDKTNEKLMEYGFPEICKFQYFRCPLHD
jgi:hypothetical protein